MFKETRVSLLVLLVLTGCERKEKSPDPISITETKATEPSKAETIDFLREELISSIVHKDSSKRANIDFDSNGRILKLSYPVDMSLEEHINIVIKNVSITLNDDKIRIWNSPNDIKEGVPVKMIKFESNEKNAIFDNGYSYYPNKHSIFEDLKDTQIFLRSDAKCSKILNAFLHLQKLNKIEAQKTSDKF